MKDPSAQLEPAGTWPLVTPRLILRHLTTDDASFMLVLLNSPAWMRFIGDRHVRSLEDAQQYIINGALNSYRQHTFGSYLVTLRKTGQSIGTCGLHRRHDRADIDIGFALLPDFAGKGYGYEAASAVMMYAAHGLGIPYLTAFCQAENKASVALLEKLGFHFEQRVDNPAQLASLRYGILLQ